MDWFHALFIATSPYNIFFGKWESKDLEEREEKPVEPRRLSTKCQGHDDWASHEAEQFEFQKNVVRSWAKLGYALKQRQTNQIQLFLSFSLGNHCTTSHHHSNLTSIIHLRWLLLSNYCKEVQYSRYPCSAIPYHTIPYSTVHSTCSTPHTHNFVQTRRYLLLLPRCLTPHSSLISNSGWIWMDLSLCFSGPI